MPEWIILVSVLYESPTKQSFWVLQGESYMDMLAEGINVAFQLKFNGWVSEIKLTGQWLEQRS